MKIKILIPVYNDWQSVFKLLKNINSEISTLPHEFSVIIVNDSSTEPINEIPDNLENFKSIQIIDMKENMGHARCVASGLKYTYEKQEFDYIIPMDGDGEDRPEDIKRFIDNLHENTDKPIVGERIKRSESAFFKFCYFLHKIITFTFTGQSIKYGNYTCLPRSIVEKMINEKATWSSFSGSLAKIAKSREKVTCERGSRYFSPSKMRFNNLLLHSLSIIAVFKLNVLLRSILFSSIYISLIHTNITIITFTPVILIMVFLASVFAVSRRENLYEFNNSISNIAKIDMLKQKE